MHFGRLLLTLLLLICGFVIAYWVFTRACHIHQSMLFKLSLVFLAVIFFFGLHDFTFMIILMLVYDIMCYVIYKSCHRHHEEEHCHCCEDDIMKEQESNDIHNLGDGQNTEQKLT